MLEEYVSKYAQAIVNDLSSVVREKLGSENQNFLSRLINGKRKVYSSDELNIITYNLTHLVQVVSTLLETLVPEGYYHSVSIENNRIELEFSSESSSAISACTSLVYRHKIEYSPMTTVVIDDDYIGITGTYKSVSRGQGSKDKVISDFIKEKDDDYMKSKFLNAGTDLLIDLYKELDAGKNVELEERESELKYKMVVYVDDLLTPVTQYGFNNKAEFYLIYKNKFEEIKENRILFIKEFEDTTPCKRFENFNILNDVKHITLDPEYSKYIRNFHGVSVKNSDALSCEGYKTMVMLCKDTTLTIGTYRAIAFTAYI